MTPSGAQRHAHAAQGPFFHPKDAMRHNRDISRAWMTFVLDKSEGYTKAGVERLNNSIRTYVWAILGAQAQTRSNILDSRLARGLMLRNNFWLISKTPLPRLLTSPVASLATRNTAVCIYMDFVFGFGLYLSPSDMALQPGNVQGYNNEIQITGSNATIGHNSGINEVESINPTSEVNKAFQGKTASPAGTVHEEPLPSQNKTRVSAVDNDGTLAADPPEKRQSATAHEEEKTALVVVGIAGGLAALWLSSR